MPYKNPARQRRAQAAWLKKRRASWLRDNGPCRRCGSTANLEVDHIDPAMKVHHRVWSWARDRREAELRKCQVLCHRCHKAKTNREQRGENNAYAKLTEEQVWEILAEHERQTSQTALANRFGTSRSNIYRIVRGQRWAHVYAAFHEQRAAA